MEENRQNTARKGAGRCPRPGSAGGTEPVGSSRSARSDGPAEYLPGPTRRPGPLIVTEDLDLLDDLLRLCAAAGVRPEVHHGVPETRGGWEAPPLVLVGEDAVPRVRRAARRSGVLLVGRDTSEPDVWRRAVEIGAENVLRLPEAEEWLTYRIADAAEGAARPALSIGVVGGRGGAGASTLACALAITAAAQGGRTMLVDADPLGGGLDVLLGGETAEGLRWPAFARSRGRVGGGALEESLPELHALRVLSWDRGAASSISPEAVRAVLAAARRRGGVVVVDLPRRLDETTAEALAQLDLGLLVVPKELRALAAASRVAATVGTVLRDVRAVVAEGTGPVAKGLDPQAMARLLDLPLVGEVPFDRDLLEAQAAGRPPGAAARGPLARFCRDFWARVTPSGPEAGPLRSPAGGPVAGASLPLAGGFPGPASPPPAEEASGPGSVSFAEGPRAPEVFAEGARAPELLTEGTRTAAVFAGSAFAGGPRVPAWVRGGGGGALAPASVEAGVPVGAARVGGAPVGGAPTVRLRPRRVGAWPAGTRPSTMRRAAGHAEGGAGV